MEMVWPYSLASSVRYQIRANIIPVIMGHAKPTKSMITSMSRNVNAMLGTRANTVRSSPAVRRRTHVIMGESVSRRRGIPLHVNASITIQVNFLKQFQ